MCVHEFVEMFKIFPIHMNVYSIHFVHVKQKYPLVWHVGGPNVQRWCSGEGGEGGRGMLGLLVIR